MQHGHYASNFALSWAKTFISVEASIDTQNPPLCPPVWCNGYRRLRVVTGQNWTGSPNKASTKVGKNCPKNARKLWFQPLRTIFGHSRRFFVGIGNGGGKQGRGNQPPYRRHGPDMEIQYRPWKPTRTCKTQQNSLQKGSRYGISLLTTHRRYGQDCGPRVCGCRFRDLYALKIPRNCRKRQETRLSPLKHEKNSEKLEKAGTVDFKKHPARKVGTRSRECRPKVPGRFAFPSARNPRSCSIWQFGTFFLAILPGLPRNFPPELPHRPRKQPQPSRVFWKMPKVCLSAEFPGISRHSRCRRGLYAT